MLKNSDMVKGRFLAWADARRKLAWIKSNLEAGRTVYICTYTRATRILPKHLANFDTMFRASKNGVFIARGKAWDCFDFSKLMARDEGAAVKPARKNRRKAA